MASEIPETRRADETDAERAATGCGERDAAKEAHLQEHTGEATDSGESARVRQRDAAKEAHLQEHTGEAMDNGESACIRQRDADSGRAVVLRLSNDLRSRIGDRADGRRILGLERHVQLREGPAGIPVIQDTIILEREPSPEALLVFVLKLAVFAMIVQSVFFLWSRCHRRSLQAFVLLLLYAFPFFLSWAMQVLWAVYLAVVVYYLRFSRRPYLLFSFSCTLMRSLYAAMFVSQVLLFVQFLSGVSVFFSLLAFVVSIYFATLSRETVRFMSSVAYLPQSISKDSCFICIKGLKERTYTLSCSHSFHSDCIKGWVLIGKKNYCPYCNARVESMSLSFMEEKFEFFSTLLDYARNLVVFLLFMYAYFAFHSS